MAKAPSSDELSIAHATPSVLAAQSLISNSSGSGHEYGPIIAGAHSQLHLGDVSVSVSYHFHAETLEPADDPVQAETEDKIIEWLCSVNFWGKQADLIDRAQPGTGSWIFESTVFKEWCAGKYRLLWCSGQPGVGKTVLSSIVIQHLSKTRSPSRGLAWIFIDYREHEIQSLETLFANLLVQLFRQRGKVSSNMIRNLGSNWQQAKPTFAQYRAWLQDETGKFNGLTIIIDALDEIRSLELGKRFIQELLDISPKVQILLTSRQNASGHELDNAIMLEIRPQPEDVVLYVESRLNSSSQLLDHKRTNPGIPALIQEKLIEANDRMFLRAVLILNLFEHMKSTKQVEETLAKLPSSYDGCYDFSLKEIERQDPETRKKAFKCLSVLTYSRLPLTVTALQHAMAVKPGDVAINEREIVPIQEILSACQGLVIVENVQGQKVDHQAVRLFHETANAYLRNFKSPDFHNGDQILLQASLTYLSFPCFSSMCIFQSIINERAGKYPFFSYAAGEWAEHALVGNFEVQHMEDIVKYLESNQRHSADELIANDRPSAWGCDAATPWTDWNKISHSRRDLPIHAAAAQGLTQVVRYLVERRGYRIEATNNWGETPLHRAAQTGHAMTMSELLALGAKLDATVHHHYLREADSLMLATACHQLDTVRVALNHGLSVNKFNDSITVPLHLAASMWTDLTRLLLDYGANVHIPGRPPCYPELLPVTSLHYAVLNADKFDGALERVLLLLDRGASINAQSRIGNTPLHIAALGGHTPIMRALLQRGARYDICNGKGETALQIAREKCYFRNECDREGLPSEFLDKLRDIPALHAAAWSWDLPQVEELLQAGADMGRKDSDAAEAGTIWTYAIRSSNTALADILLKHMTTHTVDNAIGVEAFGECLDAMTSFDYVDEITYQAAVHIARALVPYRRRVDPGLSFAKEISPISNYQKTYLIWAAELERLEQAKFLLECGADVNAQDVFGMTGLNYAVNRGNYPMCELLVQKGTNLKMRTTSGHSPFDLAKDRSNVKIKELIERAGGS